MRRLWLRGTLEDHLADLRERLTALQCSDEYIEEVLSQTEERFGLEGEREFK